MGGSSKSQTVGYKYHLGAHIALCHGPVDYLTRIKVGGKNAWVGQIAHGQISIAQTGLFGGESREGGVSGDLDFESGKPDQGVNDYLSARLGNLVPAFRGVACAVLRQMYIGMNPYLKNWEFRAQRIHTRQDGIEQWYDSKAEISAIEQPPESITVPALESNVPSWAYCIWAKFSNSGRYLIACTAAWDTAGLSAPFHIYDTTDWSIVPVNLNGLVDDVLSAAWSPDDSYVALAISAFNDGVQLLDTSNWVVSSSRTDIVRSPRFCEWSPDGAYIFVGETAYTNIINAGTMTVLGTRLDVGFASTHDIDVSPDSQYVALSGSSSNSSYEVLKVYSIGDWSVVAVFKYSDLPVEFSTVAFTADGKFIQAGQFLISTADWTVSQTIPAPGTTSDEESVFSDDNAYYLFTDYHGNTVSAYYNYTFDLAYTIAASTPRRVDISSDGKYVVTGEAGYGDNNIKVYRVSQSLPNNDMNPVHIIREGLTDPDWGMGHPESDIDDDSFSSAADELHKEGMGISLLWDRQQSIEEFIQLVLQHIDARLYVDPVTGLWTLKLVRFDYIIDNLPVLDESTIKRVESASRPAFGELVNSVTVQFWDPISGGTDSVTVQDIALAQQQGAEINTTVQYPGFTNNQIAIRVAQRDLKALSTPILSCTLYASRFAADLGIGDPFKLVWPDYGIGEMVMRVTDIAYGDDQDQTIRIKAVQDVFAIADAAITAPVDTEWQEPDQIPTPVPAQAVVELPYYEIVQILGQTQTDDLLGNNPDLGYIGVAAAQPENAINARFEVDAGGGYSDAGALDFCPTATLDQDIDPDQELIAIRDGDALEEVTIGSHAEIGTEIVRVDAISDTQITLGRGVLDTVPAIHNNGDRILFWDAYVETDGVERITNDQLDARVLPVSGDGQLDPADATPVSLTMSQRAIRPYPPGQFKINGTYYPFSIEEDAAAAVTWAHRDRIQQTGSALLDHTDGSVGPEPGVTYELQFYGESGSLLRTVSGITGTSYTYATLDEINDSPINRLNASLTIKLKSQRNGIDSYQLHTHTIKRSGWGLSWDYFWGK